MEVSKLKRARKKRAREIMNQINDVLYNCWDPFGVKNLAPHDEYNFLIAPIYRMLISGTSKQELIDRLFTLETGKTKPLFRDKRRLKTIVKKLLEINVELELK